MSHSVSTLNLIHPDHVYINIEVEAEWSDRWSEVIDLPRMRLISVISYDFYCVCRNELHKEL
jgi:hypothetical protein